MNIYSGDVSADVLQSYRNLLRNGDETLSIKYIKDGILTLLLCEVLSTGIRGTGA